MLEAFCLDFGIQERDLGIGSFYSRFSPSGEQQCQGICIFDAVAGSLRLTQRLGEHYTSVARKALSIAQSRNDIVGVNELSKLIEMAGNLRPADKALAGSLSATSPNLVEVVAIGELATFVSLNGSTEVKVKAHRYTQQGLMYELEPQIEGMRWFVLAAAILPIPGVSKVAIFSLNTGDIEK